MSEIQYFQNLKTLNDILKCLEYFRKFETLRKALELQSFLSHTCFQMLLLVFFFFFHEAAVDLHIYLIIHFLTSCLH